MRIAVEGCMHGELDNVYSTLRHLEKVENTKIDLLICCGDFQIYLSWRDARSPDACSIPLSACCETDCLGLFKTCVGSLTIENSSIQAALAFPSPPSVVSQTCWLRGAAWSRVVGICLPFLAYASYCIIVLPLVRRFSAIRNENDLESLNVKPKYRSMNTFWKYYSGQEIAPIPTIFIGGNHEASNHLWELYYGGWAAPNIYFLGFAGVIKFGNIRIGGLSGIYNQRHYYLGHFERVPYNESDIRSIYHVREYDVYKLMQIEEPIDVFISHDWPLGITDYGNWKELVRQKPFFEEEIQKKTLGSKAAAELLDKLKPPYWFSAHLHCRFPALVQHEEGESDPGPYEIHYDEEWLAITRKFNPIFPLTRKPANFRTPQLDTEDHRQWVRHKLKARGAKPFEFLKTVPFYDPSRLGPSNSILGHCRNPQTESLLQFLELPYLLDSTPESRQELVPVMANAQQVPEFLRKFTMKELGRLHHIELGTARLESPQSSQGICFLFSSYLMPSNLADPGDLVSDDEDADDIEELEESADEE
ncbi:hypothetical protein ACLOJK_003246 [Asimina triloba]